MRRVSQRFVNALHREIDRIGGNWPAVESELDQFEHSELYRRGLCREFERRWHHRPNNNELVKFFYRFVRQRARMFRCFTRS